MLKYISFHFIFISSVIFSQQYSVQLYNTDNGLPQNSVKDIIKDKYGFIWLTTENGIVRYDGTKFSVYKNFPLNSQRFTYFFGRPEKDSIFTSGDYGKTVLIHERSPRVLKTFKKNSNFISKESLNYFLYCSNYSFTTSADVNLYIDCTEGIYFIRKNSVKYMDKLSKIEKKTSLKPIYNNIVKILTVDHTLFFIDHYTKRIKKIERGVITDYSCGSLLTDPTSKIFWSAFNNQTFILNKNNIYICRFKNNKLAFSKLVTLSNNYENIISIYYDRFYRKLYLGSSTNGLQIIRLPDFTTVKRAPSKHESVFYTTLPYNQSSVVTTFGEIYNHSGIVADKSFKSISPFFMSYDDQKNIIARRVNDLVIFQKEKSYTDIVLKKNFILKDFFFDDKRYYALHLNAKKDGTTGYTGMLNIYEGLCFGSLKKQIYFDDEPLKLMKFDADHILVGTINRLYKVSLNTNKILNLTPESELSVRNIVQSSDGNFWITTLGKGFYLLKNNRLIKMPFDSENNITSAHTIIEDSRSHFWIPTNNGLYKVLRSQLLNYSQNKKNRVHYYKFSKDSGFNTNEFNGGSNICGNKLENGEFVFPSLNGLVFINPLQVNSYYPKNFYVERATVDNKEYTFNKIFTLKQEFGRADIFIDVPYFADPHNLIIEAKINDNHGSKWESIGREGKFSISSLGSGNHQFIVRLLTSDKGEYIYKQINIVVPPYFYQTLWFKICAASSILLTIYLMIRLRIRFLQKRNYELEDIIHSRTKSLSETVEKLELAKTKLYKEVEQQKKLIGTITHDITTPVKFIAMTAREIINNTNVNEHQREKILNSIYKSSDQLYNFTITLKEYADIYTHHRSDKTEIYSLYEMVEEKKILFYTIAENNNSVIINNVDQSIDMWTSKNILSAIIHNLIDNSVKFTHNGTITLESSTEGDHIILLITDSGVGMEENKIEYYTWLQDNIDNEKLLLQKYGMGLHLVLQLLQMIESKIIFTRNKVQGTSFKLILTNKKHD